MDVEQQHRSQRGIQQDTTSKKNPIQSTYGGVSTSFRYDEDYSEEIPNVSSSELAAGENVQVYVRVRPPFKKELEDFEGDICMKTTGSS